jgi:hypothetical protein
MKKGKIVDRTIQLIALSYVMFLVGGMGVAFSHASSSTFTGEMLPTRDYLAVSTTLQSYVGTILDHDYMFFETTFPHHMIGEIVRVNYTIVHGYVVGVYTYVKDWYRTSENVSESTAYEHVDFADYTTLMSYSISEGQPVTGELEFRISDAGTPDYPFVLIIVVQPMGWSNDVPVSTVFFTTTVI